MRELGKEKMWRGEKYGECIKEKRRDGKRRNRQEMERTVESEEWTREDGRSSQKKRRE